MNSTSFQRDSCLSIMSFNVVETKRNVSVYEYRLDTETLLRDELKLSRRWFMVGCKCLVAAASLYIWVRGSRP